MSWQAFNFSDKALKQKADWMLQENSAVTRTEELLQLERKRSMPASIEHRKTTVSEGLLVAFWAVSILIGMGAFLWFLPPPMLILIAFIVIVGVVALLVLSYAVLNLQSNSTFVCRLDDEQISCVSPVSLCGDSFSIPVQDITRIERVSGGETTYTWYIWNKAGQRFWLTSNYDNPVDTFLDAIRERCPDVIETHSPG